MKFKSSYFFLFISLILLGIILFKSEYVWEGNRRLHYLNYFILAFILIFFSIITFFLNKKINEILVISFLSITFSFYVYEYYLSFIKVDKNIEEVSEILKKKTGRTYDKRSRAQILKDLRGQGKKITLSFFPEYWVFKKNKNLFPLSGISNINTILCSDEGKHEIFESDKYGFRNDNNVWDKEIVDYLIVGDSFAQGFCVNKFNNISSRINQITNKNVINLAYGSNGPLIEFASIREYLPKNTKNLLWFYYEGNDLDNLNFELKNDILKKYLTNDKFSQNLKDKQKKIDEKIILEIKKNLSFQNIIFEFLKLTNTRKIFFNLLKKNTEKQVYQSSHLDQLFLILNKTKEILDINNTKFYFIYLPEFNRYQPNYNNLNYKKIINFLDTNQIELIDIHKELFSKEDNPKRFFVFERNGHYNKEGYLSISKKILSITE